MAQEDPAKHVRDFLAARTIAVVGVSRDSRQTANGIYRTLRRLGYEVKAVNPSATEVEGEPCFKNLASIPTKPEGALIVTAPEVTPSVVKECAALGIRLVWMHRSFGRGSVSSEAVRFGRDNGLSVIAGGCPLMFREGADLPHRCMRAVLSLTGRLFSKIPE